MYGKKRREKLYGKKSSRNKDDTDLSDLPIPPPAERVCLKNMTDKERVAHGTARRKKWFEALHPQRKRRMKERNATRQAGYALQRKAAEIKGGSPIILLLVILKNFALHYFNVNMFRFCQI